MALDLGIEAAAFELGGGAGGDDLQDRADAVGIRHGLAVDDGDQADRVAFGIPEGDAEVTFGLHVDQEGVARKEADDAVGVVAEAVAGDIFARGVAELVA